MIFKRPFSDYAEDLNKFEKKQDVTVQRDLMTVDAAMASMIPEVDFADYDRGSFDDMENDNYEYGDRTEYGVDLVALNELNAIAGKASKSSEAD